MQSQGRLLGLYSTAVTLLRGSAVWSAVDAGSTALASLLIAAGLVRTLGAHDYGIIVVALAVSNLSAAVNPAIAATTIKFVSEARSFRAGSRVANILTGSLLAVLAIDSVLMLLVIFFGNHIASIIFGFGVKTSSSEIKTVLFLAVSSVCLQQIDGVFAATLRGLERFRRQGLLELALRTILVISVVMVGRLTRDAQWVLAVYCAVFALSILVRAAAVGASLGKEKLFAWPDKSDVVRLLSFGGWMWLNAIATMAFGTVDKIVVGRVSGPTAAAEFNIYMQFAQLVHFVPASLFAFTFPLFSRLSGNRQANDGAIKHLYLRYTGLASFIGLGLSLIIFVWRRKLLSAFGGTNILQGHDLAFALLIIGFLLVSFSLVPYCLALGFGKPRVVSLVTSVSMVAAIAFTTILTPALGMEGAAIARLIYGFGALALVFYVRVLLKQP